MNPQDPLAALHPLRDPLPIAWWPPAPGWWILAGLCLLALAIVGWLLYRRHRARAYRRRALLELDQLRAQYHDSQDHAAYLASTNALLKSAALIAYPRRAVAASTGEQWLHFLNTTADKGNAFPADFVTGAYCKGEININIDEIHDAAAHWINRHEVKT